MLARPISRSLLVGAAFWSAFAACGDYTIDVNGGYRLVRLSGGGVFVLVEPKQRGNSILAGPSVSEYAEIDEDLIVGRVEPTSIESTDIDRGGYFILQLSDGSFSSGLSREEWRHKLLAMIGEVPELKRPNRLQSWF